MRYNRLIWLMGSTKVNARPLTLEMTLKVSRTALPYIKKLVKCSFIYCLNGLSKVVLRPEKWFLLAASSVSHLGYNIRPQAARSIIIDSMRQRFYRWLQTSYNLHSQTTVLKRWCKLVSNVCSLKQTTLRSYLFYPSARVWIMQTPMRARILTWMPREKSIENSISIHRKISKKTPLPL